MKASDHGPFSWGSHTLPGIVQNAGTPRSTASRTSEIRSQGLFPCEAEIARRLSQTPSEWAGKAKLLERDGLPRIDPIMGGRYWPAVAAFWNRRYNLSIVDVSQPDGEENLDALA